MYFSQAQDDSKLSHQSYVCEKDKDIPRVFHERYFLLEVSKYQFYCKKSTREILFGILNTLYSSGHTCSGKMISYWNRDREGLLVLQAKPLRLYMVWALET